MLKRFINYYKPHRKLFYIDMFFALLISVFDLIFPIFTRQMVNEIIPAGRMDILFRWTIAMLGLFVVRYISTYIVAYWGHLLGVYIEQDMRTDLFGHLQTLPFSYYDENETGQIMSRIVNDLRDITELAHHGPEDIFISFIMLVGSFFLLLRIEWRLTLLIYAFIPLIIFYIMARRKRMSDAFTEVRVEMGDVNAQLENSISGIRVVKSFTNEEFEIAKFHEGNLKFSEARRKSYKVMAEFASGIGIMSSFLNLLVISVGGYMVYKEVMNVGDLFAYTLYVNFFMQPIRKLVDFSEQYQQGMAGFRRFLEIMDIHTDIIEKENAVDLENVNGLIEFKDVSFKYKDGEESVLENLNIEMQPGRTIALVGPSGAGKSTLCNLIPRFYEVENGEILIDNRNIKDFKINSLRENIGIVQQDVFLFTGTIKENILYGKMNATDEEIVAAAKKASIHDFIMELPQGYDTHIGEKGTKLSGGQKQRISISRLFLKNPSILILDEATSALDNETEIQIQNALEELSKGRTTVIIAHRLSTIKNADEIFVLTKTGVVESGRHEDLLKEDGLYRKLYESQFKTLA